MAQSISFLLDGKIQTIDFSRQTKLKQTTTVLQYLRGLPNHHGVKEGCAEGDCGACTVVLAEALPDGGLSYRAVNSCLLFLPKLHGKQLITVENLQDNDGHLHPVQKSLAENNGSQCGFCTPGIVMSLFGHYKSGASAERDEIEDTLSGNLCRCTGYQPILESAQLVLKDVQSDHFSTEQEATWSILNSISGESLTLKTDSQIYHLPATLDELLKLRAKYPQALLINGSTDAALRVTKNHELLPAIIDSSNVQELKEVQTSGKKIRIGGGVSVNALMELTKDDFPAIAKMCKTFGSKQIRHLATVGGNLGSASPIGDLAPVFLACDARIIVQSAKGIRKIRMNDFITGYRQTALRPDEVILSVELPKTDASVLTGAYKISKRHDLDIATVSAGFRVELDGEGLIKNCIAAYGGMAAVTSRAEKAESFLIGKKWEKKTVEKTLPLIRESFTPISDARSGAEYRSLAAGNLLLKFYNDTRV